MKKDFNTGAIKTYLHKTAVWGGTLHGEDRRKEPPPAVAEDERAGPGRGRGVGAPKGLPETRKRHFQTPLTPHRLNNVGHT